MGNFSRPPDQQLQHATSRRYVGVRMQQGVPLLDADWNELEDLRRYEHETVGTWFIGDGVPVGSDGFHILPVSADNDFGIRQGVLLVHGKIVVLDADTSYATQPHFGDPNLNPPLPNLTTPGGDAEFVVYVDITEREVNSQEDPALVDSRIGLETAVRITRQWVVRVASVPQDLAMLDAPPTGHVFYELAYLRRKGGNAKITAPMIEDLRDTQLSIRRRIEVRNNLGTIVLDTPKFKLVLEATRNNVLGFIRYITTEFNPINTTMTAAEVLGLHAAAQITRPAEAGLALLGNQVLANRGALGVLSQLYDAENAFLEIWRDVVMHLGGTPKKYATYDHFVTRLDQRLNDPLVGSAPGLQAALAAEDLAAASSMQDAIARLFGEETNANIPRGSIDIFLTKSAANLVQGQTVTLEFTVHSFTTLADSYTVEILPQAGWTRRLVDQNGVAIPSNRVPIGAGPALSKIYIEVVVGTGTSALQLRVTSVSNPDEVTQTTESYALVEGQAGPPPASKIRLEITGASQGGNNLPWDQQQNKITLPANPLQSTIAINAYNDSASQVMLDLTATISNVVPANPGTLWAAHIAGGATIPVGSGTHSPSQARVTPGVPATSATLTISAAGTVEGTAVTTTISVDLEVA
jgi:hypothetical protein